MSICVLMSTYNGEKYIQEQIQSIIEQRTNEIITLFIRDDGSSDRTLEIISKFKKKVKINIYTGENIGPARSYLDLISKAPDAEYYAFCDQDDVWIQGKAEAATRALAKFEAPALWVSNYDIVNEKLTALEKKAMDEPETDQLRALFYNNVPGCTMIFNKALMAELKKVNIRNFHMHDILTLGISLITGHIIFDEHTYILYRQHSTNALGAIKYRKKLPFLKRIRKKITKWVFNESDHYDHYAQRILELYSSCLDSDMIDEYQLIKNYKRRLNRIILLKKYYTHDRLGRSTISAKMRILLGKV